MLYSSMGDEPSGAGGGRHKNNSPIYSSGPGTRRQGGEGKQQIKIHIKHGEVWGPERSFWASWLKGGEEKFERKSGGSLRKAE